MPCPYPPQTCQRPWARSRTQRRAHQTAAHAVGWPPTALFSSDLRHVHRWSEALRNTVLGMTWGPRSPKSGAVLPAPRTSPHGAPRAPAPAPGSPRLPLPHTTPNPTAGPPLVSTHLKMHRPPPSITRRTFTKEKGKQQITSRCVAVQTVDCKTARGQRLPFCHRGLGHHCQHPSPGHRVRWAPPIRVWRLTASSRGVGGWRWTPSGCPGLTTQIKNKPTCPFRKGYPLGIRGGEGDSSTNKHEDFRIPPQTSHIRCGAHPPNFMVIETTKCAASPASVSGGRHGAEAALVRRGTTVPLSPTIPMPSGWGRAMQTISS